MSPRTRGLAVIAIAAVVFAALVWADAAVLARGRDQALATFNMSSFIWLLTAANLVVVAAAILFAGLAWWSRSLLASIVFLLGGAAQTLVVAAVFTFTGDWPLGLNLALSWWITTSAGPANAATILGAGLIIAGLIGFYRWAFTRRLTVTDA